MEQVPIFLVLLPSYSVSVVDFAHEGTPLTICMVLVAGNNNASSLRD